MKQIATFDEAIRFLEENKVNSKTFKFGSLFLDRARYLMQLLGNPQDELKIIHIAGTSGKGSTAYFVSTLLVSQGFKVGLSVKPHVEDIRERFQINNNLVSKEDFIVTIRQIASVYDIMEKSSLGPPSYFEMTVAIAFLLFIKHSVDYAVIETGMGGKFDATNTVHKSDKVVILTKIGFDHMQYLGNTLSKIAQQKAAIIHKNNRVFASWQKPSVQEVFNQSAKKNTTVITYISRKSFFSNIGSFPNKTFFDYNDGFLKISNVQLSLLGSHQVENASLALAAFSYLSQRDSFPIREKTLRKALSQAFFPARMEIVKKQNKSLIIDGAHNTQKMKALTQDLKAIFPNKKFHFLVGFKEGKDIRKMMSYIIPLADYITVAGFYTENTTDWTVYAQKPEVVGKFLEKNNFNHFSLENNCHVALRHALSKVSQGKLLIITGSLYLISELYHDLKA